MLPFLDLEYRLMFLGVVRICHVHDSRVPHPVLGQQPIYPTDRTTASRASFAGHVCAGALLDGAEGHDAGRLLEAADEAHVLDLDGRVAR